jgi:DNA polymerase (family 10)
MKNKELAKKLMEIAELLALSSEDNRFHIVAYEKAARSLESLNESIETVVAEGRLKEIKGIGPRMTERIVEFLKTGHIADLDEMKRQFPAGLLEIMALQGMGPKKTKILYDKLHISSIEQLRAAAAAGKLRDLAGFGEKTEKNILQSVAFKSRTSTRVLIHEAVLLAEEVIALLKKNPAVITVQYAGSLRRQKETIGDIDILCVTKRNEEKKVIDQFVSLPHVHSVLATGDTKAAILTNDGVQIDLRVIDPSSFGAALLYFTGSKDHNVALRSLARDKGMTINEYGIFSLKDKNVSLGGVTEEEMYQKVGMHYIPPVLRECRGEIEAAVEGTLPKLIERDDIKGDFHTHSTYSDGDHSIAEIANKATSLGYQWIVITDHSQSLKVARGLSPDSLRQKMLEVQAYNKKNTGITVLCGTEVDILADGTIDYADELLQQLDFVIASIHSGFKQTEEQITRRIIAAISHPHVHCIGHLTGRLLGEREAYPVDIEKVLKAARDYHKSLEINAQPYRLELQDIYCKKAKEMGIKLCIGTDAHTQQELDYMQFGVSVAQRGWLEKQDVLNTMDYKTLSKHLKGTK